MVEYCLGGLRTPIIRVSSRQWCSVLFFSIGVPWRSFLLNRDEWLGTTNRRRVIHQSGCWDWQTSASSLSSRFSAVSHPILVSTASSPPRSNGQRGQAAAWLICRFFRSCPGAKSPWSPRTYSTFQANRWFDVSLTREDRRFDIDEEPP